MKLLFSGFFEIMFLLQPVLCFSAVTSLVWGAFYAANECKIKKFLAFSSINQLGFVLLNCITVNFICISYTYTYLFIYLITNISFFLILTASYKNVFMYPSYSTINTINTLYKVSFVLIRKSNFKDFNHIFETNTIENTIFSKHPINLFHVLNLNFESNVPLKYITDFK